MITLPVVVMDCGTLHDPELALLDAANRHPARTCSCPWSIPLHPIDGWPYPTGALILEHHPPCPDGQQDARFTLVGFVIQAPGRPTSSSPRRQW